MKTRAFIATHTPATPLVRTLLSALASLKPPIKITQPQNLHITLRFLGDTDTDLIPEIKNAIELAAQATRRVTLPLYGLTASPNPHRPKTLWLNTPHHQPLAQLATNLDQHLGSLGFPLPTRPVQPHVTVARIKAHPPKALSKLLKQFKNTQFGHVPLDNITLYKSNLTPQGPIYTPLHRVHL